jgi:hypothetical protein
MSKSTVIFRQQSTNTRREDLIQDFRAKIEDMRMMEIGQLIRYIKEEDPETCINILFVLSQSKSDQTKDELNLLMDRLHIKKEFLVECMRTVLYDNLTEFFHSLGKQKHHIKQFESSSSEASEYIKKEKRHKRTHSRSRKSTRHERSREKSKRKRDTELKKINDEKKEKRARRMVKVEIKEDEQFVIKGDQLIPRSGFSRTIRSDA